MTSVGDSRAPLLQRGKRAGFLGKKGYLLATECYGVSKNGVPNVFLPLLMVNSGKITRNLGVFVLFLPWLSERPLSLGQSMDRIVEFFESRIRLAQWRARVLLLGLTVML